MRRIAYLGDFERLDMRNAVGKDEKKFIFFGALDPAFAKRRTIEEVKTAALQHANGVEMTNEDALKILTTPDVPGGFYDYTDKEVAPATMADAQAVNPEAIGPSVSGEPVNPSAYDTPVPLDPAIQAQNIAATASGRGEEASPKPPSK